MPEQVDRLLSGTADHRLSSGEGDCFGAGCHPFFTKDRFASKIVCRASSAGAGSGVAAATPAHSGETKIRSRTKRPMPSLIHLFPSCVKKRRPPRCEFMPRSLAQGMAFIEEAEGQRRSACSQSMPQKLSKDQRLSPDSRGHHLGTQMVDSSDAVSYTHLTLPTIPLV